MPSRAAAGTSGTPARSPADAQLPLATGAGPRRRLGQRSKAVPGAGPDAGMVTAETAILLPALVVVLAGLLWVIASVTGELRCLDAAREAARLAGRGDTTPQAVAVARRLAPPGAAISITRNNGQVVATVTARPVPFSGWAARLPGLPLRASSTATDEAALTSAPVDSP